MTIIVYTRPDCIQCEWTKRRLAAEGIAFQAIDVTEDATAMAEAERLSRTLGRQIPIVVAGDQAWSGFRDDLIRRLSATNGGADA